MQQARTLNSHREKRGHYASASTWAASGYGSGLTHLACPSLCGTDPACSPDGGYVSHNVSGCGNISLWVPNQPSSFYANNPQAVLPPVATKGIGTLSVARLAASRPTHWLSSLSCKATNRHSVPPRTTPSHGSVSPDTINNYQYSGNWAGYQDIGGGITTAQQMWTVPFVNGPNNLTKVSSIWPGIGTGDNSGDSLIQAGSEQDGACGEPGCFTQSTSYYYWLEIYPQESSETITNLSANPGDRAGVEVDFNPSNKESTFLVCDFSENSCVTGNEYVNAGGSSGVPSGMDC